MSTCDQTFYLDIIGGIAGDMFIAAMLDCDESLKGAVEANIAKIVPSEVGCFNVTKGLNKGISGLCVTLEINSSVEGNHGEETTYKNLVARINQSDLNESVKTTAIELFTLLAEVEAKIHNKHLENVHFHELADWDSLMDIVAIATILSCLATSKWGVSSIPIGHGRVKTTHGILPIPAPATMQLLKGFEFIDDGEEGERVTPTGALILAYLNQKGLLLDHKQLTTKRKLQAIGYGLGQKVFKTLPNVLRVSRFQTINEPLNVGHQQTYHESSIAIVEFEIDDMTGEEIGTALNTLRQQHGVLDVNSVTVRGKKNRPMERVQLIVTICELDAVNLACFTYTSTIGLRWRIESRACLTRENELTDHGRIKTVIRPANCRSRKIEHDDLNSLLPLSEQRRAKYHAEFDEH